MITLLLHLFRLLPFLLGGHRQLALENLALRQQLAVYKRTVTRPKIRTTDRVFWVGLARVWAAWRQPLVIVTPNTVLRWQHRRFCEYWSKFSGRSTGGRPTVHAEIKTLITRMATANPLWGAPRIHGELLKLGIDVAERTVSRLMPKRRPQPSQTWRTFLANHVRDLVALDFFTVPTARLRVLFVLVVLAHHRRRVVHFNVTEHPTALWTAQQIVDAFPDDSAPSYLLRDRDSVYGHVFRHRVKGMGIDEIVTAPQSPWQNPLAERLIGSIRRECLDHVLVLGERYLRRTLTRYFAYYHEARTHLSLDKDAPDGRSVERPERGRVISIREVGGLHHRYGRRAA
jgi:putative transposase